MVNNAETTAKNAESTDRWAAGYCQQFTRSMAGIGGLYADAATAWKNTNDRHPGDRHPPRGAAVFWTGGSHGYGHAVVSLGNGKIRSTDACGSGCVTTRDLGWVEAAWGLTYAGWAWDINEVTIPHGEEEDMPLNKDDKEWLKQAIDDGATKAAERAANKVWAEVLQTLGDEPRDVAAERLLAETHKRAGEAKG